MRTPRPGTRGAIAALATLLTLSAALAASLLAERWVGAATLPRWLPAAPYGVSRALHALPFTHAGAWERLREHLVVVARQPSTLPDPSLGHHPSQVVLSGGSYLGWTDGATGNLTLYGHACRPADPPAGMLLTVAGREVPVAADAIHTSDLDVGTYFPVPVTRVEAALPAGDYAPVATVRCRSGAESRHQLGALRIVELAPNRAGLLVDVWAAPLTGIYAYVFLMNPGPEAVTVTRVDYAPTAAATGEVLAYAPPEGVVARLEHVVADRDVLERLSADPHAADLPATWPTAAAADLALRLPAGGTAIVVIHSGSFHATRPRLPTLFHPVVGYELDDGTRGAVTSTRRTAAGWTAR